MKSPTGQSLDNPPWLKAAVRRLDDAEKSHGSRAYVFVTAFGSHLNLAADQQDISCLAYGFNIPTFSKPGLATLSDIYRQRMEHQDAERIGEAIQGYPGIPNTFDGTMLHGPGFQIGDTLEYPGEAGLQKGVVEEAAVNAGKPEMWMVLRCDDGKRRLIARPISDLQLEEYQKHPETFFGVYRSVGKHLDNPFDLFLWSVEGHRNRPRSFFEGRLSSYFSDSYLADLSDEDLLLKYVEGLVANTIEKQNSTKESHRPRGLQTGWRVSHTFRQIEDPGGEKPP